MGYTVINGIMPIGRAGTIITDPHKPQVEIALDRVMRDCQRDNLLHFTGNVYTWCEGGIWKTCAEIVYEVQQ